MKILLDNIKQLIEDEEISLKQALYMVYLYESKNYSICDEDLIDLMEKGHVTKGKVALSLITETYSSGLSGTIVPKYTTKKSQDTVIQLCKLFCTLDKKGNIIFAKDANPLKYTAKHYLQNEELIAYHYLIFMYLFPLRGDNNKNWEKHFIKTKYKGARLRQRTNSSAIKFKRIAKTKDMGAFLLGTYLFIKSSIQGSNTYIKSISNYLLEYQEWYDEALQLLKDGKDIQTILKKHNTGSDNVTIII